MKPEPNLVIAVLLQGIADIMVVEKKLHYLHFYGGSCRGDADFLALLSLSYEKFVVTLRMAALYRILILCVGFALSNNLWAQSLLFLLCLKGGKR